MGGQLSLCLSLSLFIDCQGAPNIFMGGKVLRSLSLYYMCESVYMYA